MKGYNGIENAPQDSSPLVDYIDFNLTPTDIMQEGRLMWDSTDGTLQIGMPGGNVNIQIGQEQLLRVTNKTGSDIANGSVVYVNGAQGQRPTIALADADTEATSDTVIGITTELITNNNNGYVCMSGLVRSLNTNAFNNGDVLYLSQTVGQFTNTAPTPPAHAIILGNVIHKGLADGVVLVNIQIGQELNDLHDVLISAPTNGDVLEYETSSTLWKNKSTLSAHIANVSNPHQTSDANLVTSDITTNNATTLKHGFLPKLSGSASQYLNGQGNYASIAGSSTPPGYTEVSFTGQTSVNVVHDFGIKPLVQCLDNTNAQIISYTVTHNTDNDFTVTFSASTTGTIIASAGSPSVPNVTTTGTNYTILVNDNIVIASAAGITLTLPTAVGYTGKTYITDNASTGSITITGTGGQTLQGETSQILSSGNSIEWYSNGTNWRAK